MVLAKLVYPAYRPINFRRYFGISCCALNKVNDPIQKLFLDQIQKYGSMTKDGKMVESSSLIEKEKKNELERVAKQFGGGSGVDMTQFPEFKFKEPKIDAISQ